MSLFRGSMNNGEIAFLNIAGIELPAEKRSGLGILCHHEGSGRFPVKPVHGLRGWKGRRMDMPQLMNKIITEGDARAMDEQIAGFIDAEKPRIFISDAIREIGLRLFNLPGII